MPVPIRCVLDYPDETGSKLRLAFSQPRLVLTAQAPNDVIALLRQVEAQAKAGRWAVGMVGYEAAPAFDPAFRVHQQRPDLPLAAFAVFDAPCTTEQIEIYGNFSCGRWQDEIGRTAFERKVDLIRQDIGEGRYYQTNFTSRFRADFAGDAGAFFRALCAAQPNSYGFFLDFDLWRICSVSPELFFTWNPQTGALTTRPMKGTAAAGPAAAEQLRLSAKDRAENLMIIDLLRNDIARVATIGSVQVPELFAVQSLPTISQMTSTVTGITRPATGLADIFTALFPCGSVTGAPKIAAMQAIAAHEVSPRGVYCGALGVVQPGGRSIFSVGIRTVTIAQNRAECGIGSGIIWDSIPSEEFAEGRIKRRFLLRASASFDLLETLRLEAGGFRLLARHLERLQRSSVYFGFALDEYAARRALDELAAGHRQGAYRVRLLVSRTGAVTTEIFPLEPNSAVVQVALAERPIRQDDEFLRHKTTERSIYQGFTPKSPEIFDTLLLNDSGEITEFTRGNVMAEIGGQRVTPPLRCGLLPGTLRAQLLADDLVAERVIMKDDLAGASGLWFINGLRGIIPARFIPPFRA